MGDGVVLAVTIRSIAVDPPRRRGRFVPPKRSASAPRSRHAFLSSADPAALQPARVSTIDMFRLCAVSMRRCKARRFRTSFLQKCKRDTCATQAVDKNGKALAGAARNSFMKKCEREQG